MNLAVVFIRLKNAKDLIDYSGPINVEKAVQFGTILAGNPNVDDVIVTEYKLVETRHLFTKFKEESSISLAVKEENEK